MGVVLIFQLNYQLRMLKCVSNVRNKIEEMEGNLGGGGLYILFHGPTFI